MSKKTPQYWMENTSKSDIPFARIFDLFDCDEIIPSAKNKAADVGVELRYATEEMPMQMAEDGDCLDANYLAQVEKPSWSHSDGWKLLGAWDNEDSEIVLCYGREIKRHRHARSWTEQVADLTGLYEDAGVTGSSAREAAEDQVCEAYNRGYERAKAECAADTRRLDYLGSGCCDVRFRAEPIADTGDADTYCDVIEHHMAEPKERIVGSADTIRAAIDAAMEGRNG